MQTIIISVDKNNQNRSFYAVLGITVPAIALTANALSDAREFYLETGFNGFNDYLAKPIKGQELEAMLKKWLPSEKVKS